MANRLASGSTSTSGCIRLATPGDAARLQAIYAPVVRDTTISFETEPPTPAEMRLRVEQTLAANLPWLVLDQASEVVGYVYAARHRGDRAAYRWSVEVSVYIDAAWHRKGIGRALYTSLFSVLRLQGFQNAYAGATQPNPGSVALHESLGFQEVGRYRKAGYKMGAWHDVLWWYLDLGTHPDAPREPMTLAEAQRQPGWHAALDAGLRL